MKVTTSGVADGKKFFDECPCHVQAFDPKRGEVFRKIGLSALFKKGGDESTDRAGLRRLHTAPASHFKQGGIADGSDRFLGARVGESGGEAEPLGGSCRRQRESGCVSDDVLRLLKQP